MTTLYVVLARQATYRLAESIPRDWFLSSLNVYKYGLRIHKPAESIPLNRFLGSLNIYKYRLWLQDMMINQSWALANFSKVRYPLPTQFFPLDRWRSCVHFWNFSFRSSLKRSSLKRSSLNQWFALSDVRTLFFDNSLIALHSFSFTQKIKDHSSVFERSLNL